MAINKKLIHFETLTKFQSADGINTTSATQSADANQLVGNIPYHSIVFIKDVCKFWTHGKYYDCNNTWRGIQNNLTSTSTTDSLSAYQGKILNEKFANYLPLSGGTLTGALTVPSLTVTGASTFSQAINGSILGNAATASRLQNARTISLSGSVTGSGTFDGSGNLSIATTTNHNFDGRYLRWGGSAADVTAMGWGTLTTANGYTILSHAASSDGGDWGMVNKGGQIFMQLDGYYYQREGQYRVIDTSEITSYGSRNNGANKIVTTDSNGYLYTGWINTTSGPTTSTIDRIYASNDGFIRYVTPATFRTQVIEPYYVNLTGTQTISGNKTFSSSVSIDDLTAGNLVVTGGASFAQTINGNAATANKLQTARTITIGNKSNNFDGSGNISFTLAQIGAQASGNYKTKQTAVATIGASTNTLTFINSISQDTNGVITATTGVVRDASTSAVGVVNLTTQSFAGAKTFTNDITIQGTTSVSKLITATTASGTEMGLKEVRTGGASVGFGVGSGNTNHGVYSYSHSKWLIYSSSSDTNAKVYVNGTEIPNSVTLLKSTDVGTASTHAHTDYVTSISYDSTNRKLQQSKGGATATDIVTFGSNAFNSTSYLPTAGGKMTGAIKRYYSAASNDPMIALSSNNLDVWLWRINHSASDATVSTSGVYGFGLKYLGAGDGNNNDLVLYADAQSGTQVEVYRVHQDGSFIFKSTPYVGSNTVMLSNHAANGITSTNITNWNSVYTWYTTAAGTSASGVIDNWNEIKNFIDGFHESDDLAEYLVNTFVAKTGGTMTGALTVPSLSVTGSSTFSQAINGSILGNAATASRLQNARTISFTGAFTGSYSFDGSANISINTSHSHSYLPVAQVSEEQNTNATWGKTYAESHRQSFVYNTSGREWAYWIGMRSSDTQYGTILRLSHDGLVQYAHKAGGGAGANWSAWKDIITSDNIGNQSVNYATSAGSASSATSADSATKDGSGNTITDTYLPLTSSTTKALTSTVSGWGWTFQNGNTNSIMYVAHNGGYGMHLRGYTTSAGVYLMQLYNNTAEQFSVYANGRVYAAGNVGIGSTSPSYKLHVVGSTYSSSDIIAGGDIRVSGNDLYIGSASGSQCHQQYDATNKVLKFIFD